MARIRTIKPEFWPDEKLGPLEPIHRLTFLGIVSQADDAGRIVDNVRLLDGLLFPLTNDTCGPSLDTLASLGVIARGVTASGQRVIQVVNWSKHQKVDKPSRKAILPPLVESHNSNGINHSRDPRESVATESGEGSEAVAGSSRYDLGSVDLGPTTLDLRPGTEDLRAREEPAWLTGEPHASQPAEIASKAEPPTAAVVGPVLGGFLDEFPEIAELVIGLKHEGGAKSTAATIRHRFLFPDDEQTLADPVVKGLPLPERRRLVHVALLEYATQPEPWARPHFTGFVKRLREQEAKPATNGRHDAPSHTWQQQPPPPEPEPAVPPEEAQRILREAKQRMKRVPAAEPEGATESRREQQKRKLAELAKGKP